MEGTTRAGAGLLGELMRQLLFIEPERLEWEEAPDSVSAMTLIDSPAGSEP